MSKTPSTTIRVDPQTHERLRAISRDKQTSIGQVVTDLVEQFEKELFWSELEGSLKKLKSDPKAWQEYQDEIALWDTTSGEGLGNEPLYYAEEDNDARAG